MLDIFGECLKRIRSHRVQLMATLSTNSCRTFEDYRFLCGQIRGLQEADDLLHEMHDRLVNPQNKKNEEEEND